MEVPEKLYISVGDAILDIYSKKESNEEIEYIRTDALIDKACKWLKNSTYGYLTEKWGETEIDRETLASDFINYMKGEEV